MTSLNNFTFAAEISNIGVSAAFFLSEVGGSQKLITAPMAQGMKHIVYVTLRK